MEVLGDMISGRFSCGVVVWKQEIYVFGSFGGTGRSNGEKQRIGGVWELVGDMSRPRSSFTPVVWTNSIYLCGGYRNDTIEVYDGTSIRLLHIKLSEGTNTLCCLSRSSLLILTSSYLTILSKQETELVKEEKKHRTCPLYLYQAPMCLGEVVLNLTEEKVMKYSLETGELL